MQSDHKHHKPFFIRTAEYLGNLRIDTRKIELSPQYYRPPWTEMYQRNLILNSAQSSEDQAIEDSKQKQQDYIR
jgi:hypothetical protein